MTPVQPAERFSSINGLRIHYLDWGTAGRRPLILLHGIARVARAFDHLAPHFLRDYHVIAVDLRGHGESSWDPRADYLVEDYAKDVETLIGELGFTDLVLWGNSTGGRVAQVLAGSRPELVSAVIVEDVGPERPPAISDRRAKRMATEENGWASTEELLAKVQSDYSAHARAAARGLRPPRVEAARGRARRLEARSGHQQGFRADRDLAPRARHPGAHYVRSGRREHHRSGGNAS